MQQPRVEASVSSVSPKTIAADDFRASRRVRPRRPPFAMGKQKSAGPALGRVVVVQLDSLVSHDLPARF